MILRLTFALALIAFAAAAQVAEIGVHGGMSLLSNNELVPGVELGDGFRLGFRLTLNSYRFFGHEFGYAYNRTNLTLSGQKYGMAIHQGGYNFLAYALPEGSPVRPFFTGGAHFNNYVPPGSSVTSGGGSTKFGLNYGGGVKVRVSPMFLIRADVRQYHTPKPDFFIQAPSGWLRQTELSAGFSFAL